MGFVSFIKKFFVKKQSEVVPTSSEDIQPIILNATNNQVLPPVKSIMIDDELTKTVVNKPIKKRSYKSIKKVTKEISSKKKKLSNNGKSK